MACATRFWPHPTRRFPAFRVPPDYVAVVQPDGGFVEVEPALAAQIALATAAGAELRAGERVRAIELGAGVVRIVTERGTIAAKAAIIAAGPWTGSLLPELAAPLRVTREVTGWFEPADATLFAPGRFPVFIIEPARHITASAARRRGRQGRQASPSRPGGRSRRL